MVFSSQLNFALTTLYSRSYKNFKNALWWNLALFSSHFKGSWVVLGDFNKISSISKKFGGNPPNHNQIYQFNNFLNCCNISTWFRI